MSSRNRGPQVRAWVGRSLASDSPMWLDAVLVLAFAVAVFWCFGCSSPVAAWIDKGDPHLSAVTVVRGDGSEYHATATLNGQLKGPQWLCPLVVWSCEAVDGAKVRGSQRVELPCSRGAAERVFTWTYEATEPCQVRLSIEPANGKRALVSRGPRPAQWDGR